MKITIKKISFFLLAIIITLILIIGLYFTGKQNKAVQIATQYLQEKYEESMVYSGVRFSWADPSLYHVYFYPEGRKSQLFEVLISPNLSYPDERKIGSYSLSSDNYLLQSFCYGISEHLQNLCKQFEVNSVKSVIVLTDNTQSLYYFKVPNWLNENTSQTQLLENTEYKIKFFVDFKISDGLQDKEAQVIFNVVQLLLNNKYSPTTICFQYANEDQTQNGTAYTLKNWTQISSIKQIEAQLEATGDG